MKYAFALPTVIALAAPAAASTLTHSFDIRLTPRHLLAFDTWTGYRFGEGSDPLPSGLGCFSSGDDHGLSECGTSGGHAFDLVELQQQYGPTFASSVGTAPVEGRISFTETDHVTCTGNLHAVMLSCGQIGRPWPEQSYIPPSQWNTYVSATSTFFALFGTDGSGGWEESFSSYGGHVDVDSSASISFGQISMFTQYPGYRLTYDLEILLEDTQAGQIPVAPLPASLPLLAGVIVGAGWFGRRRRASRR